MKIADIAKAYPQGGYLAGKNWNFLAFQKQLSVIGQVPGENQIRGVVEYKDDLYAFRDSGEECLMYRATPSGWVQVPGVSFSPGGSFRFRVHNFKGSSGSRALYGCNGIDKAFEWDGSTFTSITTGMSDDAPQNLEIHKQHLFLAFAGGSLQHSPPADPAGTWEIISGAEEIGLGDNIVDLKVVAGALAVWTEHHIQILYGSNSASDPWVLKHHAELGISPNTVQNFGNYPVFHSQGSLMDLAGTEAYGDFKSSSISKDIDPFLKRAKMNITASCVLPWKNQYRLFYEGGFCMAATRVGGKLEYTFLEYPVTVRTCFVGEDSVWFTSDDGFVYKMDSSDTHAGKPIDYFMKTAASFLGMPGVRKLARKLELDLEEYGGRNFDVRILLEVGKYRRYSSDPPAIQMSSMAGDGYWGSGLWGDFIWHGDAGGLPEARLSGVGVDFSFTIYHKGVPGENPKYILNGGTFYFSPRGRQR